MDIYQLDSLSVKVDGIIIPYSTKVKNLGVTMDCNLS
jgi:hypothetical protein